MTPLQREYTHLMGRQAALDLLSFIRDRRRIATGEDAADLHRARMHAESLLAIMERIGARGEEPDAEGNVAAETGEDTPKREKRP